MGGVKLQLLNNVTGFLVHSLGSAANRAIKLLDDESLRRMIGANGHEHLRGNFLTTRHIRDYLLLMLSLENRESDLTLLSSM